MDAVRNPFAPGAGQISIRMMDSSSHGDIAFTVPMFSEYLIRNYVEKADKP
jgi:hypothetical protein